MDLRIEELLKKLEELLMEKKETLSAIYDLTMKQKSDIEANEGSSLESFIDDKQMYIDKIKRNDALFRNVFEILKKEVGVDELKDIELSTYPNVKLLKDQIQDIFQLTEKIIKQEETNSKSVEKLIDDIKVELKQTRTGQKSISAYDNQSIATEGVYIDKKK